MKSPRLITDLIDKYDGPILVIGGGPSVPSDFDKLPADFKPACVLSANNHGFKQDRFKVDYIVCVDNLHSETKQRCEEWLRPYGVPIITRHWWGDYRMPRLRTYGNSGQTACAVGVMLGGHPVIATGMDCWQGKTYFHDPDVKVACSGRSLGQVAKQLRYVKDWIGDPNVVRVVSGPMIPMFKQWTRHEDVSKLRLPAYATALIGGETYTAIATKTISYEVATIPAGSQFPVSKEEAAYFRVNHGRFRCRIINPGA